MVQLIKGREPFLEMRLPQIFAEAIALGYQKAYQEQKAQKRNEALISRILMEEQLRREQEATKPTKLDYYDPGDILTQARGQYSMYVPLSEYGKTVQDLTGAGYRMGTMKQPGLPTLGTTRDIKRGTQLVQQQYTDQGWQDIGEGPRFKPSETSTVNPKYALKRINDLLKSNATLEKTDTVTAFLAIMNPELQEMIGQKISPEMKQNILQARNNEINFLNQYLPEKFKFKLSEKATTTELPEGLTEKDIQYNMKKYGKTRQEVIDAYNRKFGNIR